MRITNFRAVLRHAGKKPLRDWRIAGRGSGNPPVRTRAASDTARTIARQDTIVDPQIASH